MLQPGNTGCRCRLCTGLLTRGKFPGGKFQIPICLLVLYFSKIPNVNFVFSFIFVDDQTLKGTPTRYLSLYFSDQNSLLSFFLLIFVTKNRIFFFSELSDSNIICPSLHLLLCSLNIPSFVPVSDQPKIIPVSFYLLLLLLCFLYTS